MWFGTMSRIRPRPWARKAAAMARKSASVPSSGLKAVRVGDVVAVGAARAGGEDRRGIDVADAEIGEVGRERGGVGEAEGRGELQAVGGAQGHGSARGRSARSAAVTSRQSGWSGSVLERRPRGCGASSGTRRRCPAGSPARARRRGPRGGRRRGARAPRARWRWTAVTMASGAVSRSASRASSPVTRPAATRSPRRLRRSTSRAAACSAAASGPIRPCSARRPTSSPRHQPWKVGRSWVERQTSAFGG